MTNYNYRIGKAKTAIPKVVALAAFFAAIWLNATVSSAAPPPPILQLTCEQYVLCELDTNCINYFTTDDQVCIENDITLTIDCHTPPYNVRAQSSDEDLITLLDNIAAANQDHYEAEFLNGIGFPDYSDGTGSPYSMTSSQGYESFFDPSQYNGNMEVHVFDDLVFIPKTTSGDYDFQSTGHGLAVTSIINQVGCYGSSNFTQCQTSFKNHDTLTDPRNNPVTLARSICSAAENHPDPNVPMVMNFSLGFPSDDPFGFLVERALKWNMCKNPKTLSFASSGNTHMTDWEIYDKDGVLAPAAWEDVMYDDFQSHCSAMGFNTTADNDLRLVYAVGATDSKMDPLTNTRTNSFPRFVTMGDHGAIENTVFGRRTPPMSGTSVSAAVLSGLATQLWKDRDNKTAKEIIDEIHDSASVIPGLQAEFCTDAYPTCDVRYVSISDTLTQVLGITETIASPSSVTDLFPSLSTLNWIDWNSINPQAGDPSTPQPGSIGCGVCNVLLSLNDPARVVLPMDKIGTIFMLQVIFMDINNEPFHKFVVFEENLPSYSPASIGSLGATDGGEGVGPQITESQPSQIDLLCRDIILPMSFDVESMIAHFPPNARPECFTNPADGPSRGDGISIPLVWEGKFPSNDYLYDRAEYAMAEYYILEEDGAIVLGSEPIELKKIPPQK